MSKEIPLSKQVRSNSNKQNAGLVAIVDDEDDEFLMQWNWSAVSTHRRNGGYAMRRDNRTGKTFLRQRVILDAPDGSEVDHINANGLDNRRANLRFATRQQGQANRRVFKSNQSGFKGVHFDQATGKWKMVFSAHFDTAEEAAHTYDKLAKMVFGDYAKGNFDE